MASISQGNREYYTLLLETAKRLVQDSDRIDIHIQDLIRGAGFPVVTGSMAEDATKLLRRLARDLRSELPDTVDPVLVTPAYYGLKPSEGKELPRKRLTAEEWDRIMADKENAEEVLRPFIAGTSGPRGAVGILIRPPACFADARNHQAGRTVLGGIQRMANLPGSSGQLAAIGASAVEAIRRRPKQIKG